MNDLKESKFAPEMDNLYFLQDVGKFLEEHNIRSVDDLEKVFEPSPYVVLPISILERKDLSATAKVVYAEICALARRSGYCFASNGHLAKQTGSSERTITRAVAELAKKKLVVLQMSMNKNGTVRNIIVEYGRVDKMARPPRQNVQTPLAKVSTIEINTIRNSKLDKTPARGAEDDMTSKNIEDFIGQFRKVNPAYAQLFKRKNQRDAALRLYKMKGWDVWLQFFASYSVKFKTDPYCPKATTPMELEAKLGKIIAYGTGLQIKKRAGESRGRGFV